MLLCPKLLPIMPALCSIPACTYYASKYASILGSGLLGGGGGGGGTRFAYLLHAGKKALIKVKIFDRAVAGVGTESIGVTSPCISKRMNVESHTVY